MKKHISNSYLIVILVFLSLPAMSQDYMNIFFKNGDFRKYYMKNIREITASKVDSEGEEHIDYDYLHIRNWYSYDKSIIYNLEDVDSITFGKVNEELGKQNFTLAMSEVFPTISECETIHDAEGKLDMIKRAKGIEDAWSDGHQLYVKIDEDETYSFHFDHDAYMEDYIEEVSNQARAQMEKVNAAISNGGYLSGVIANQQDKDENRTFYRENYYNPLKDSELRNFNWYYRSPTVDFFAKYIYEHDIVFLITHGSYSPYNISDKEEIYLHSIATADDLCIIDISNDNLSIDDWAKLKESFTQFRANKIWNATDLELDYCFIKEMREGKWCWVGHPSITEKFFDHIATGSFSNRKSILFNTACQSLKGKEGIPSNSLASKLFDRGLGVYLGYDETNSSGKRAGSHFFNNLLQGKSIQKAAMDLSEQEKRNVLEDGTIAQLRAFTKDDKDEVRQRFLFPIYTSPLLESEARWAYFQGKSITVKGLANLSEQNPQSIKLGFFVSPVLFDSNDTSMAIDVEATRISNVIEWDGKVSFEASLPDLEFNKTYYYIAYLYDGLYYNFGDVCSFNLGDELKISIEDISPVRENYKLTINGKLEGFLTLDTLELENFFYRHYPKLIVKKGKDVITKDNIDNADRKIDVDFDTDGNIFVRDKFYNLSLNTVYSFAFVFGGLISETKYYEWKLCPDDSPHPHMIDLGLPSGTKWACCDVGATNPEEAGLYFAWGEIGGKTNKKDCNDDTYEYSYKDEKGHTIYKYIGDDIAGTSYDVAKVLWKENWQMPTINQIRELIDNTDARYGGIIIGPNGGVIQLHASYDENHLVNNYGVYWSSTIDNSDDECAKTMDISWFWGNLAHGDSNLSTYSSNRSNGHFVRPVVKF